jgi:opine dehydrogenase
MQLSAVSIDIRQLSASIAVTGYGEQARAVAALLATSGHSVRLLSPDAAKTTWCEVWQNKDDQGQIVSRVQFAVVSARPSEVIRAGDVVIVAAGAENYAQLVEDIAPVLSSGQSIFLMDAAFGAALEFSHLLSQRRNDLALNIVEIGSLFDVVEVDGETVRIKGVKQQISICGRTLNETRAGLSVGANLWQNLVPTSNLFERGFSDVDRFAVTVLRFLTVLTGDARTGTVTGMSLEAIKIAVEQELQAIAKIYGVTNMRVGKLPNLSETVKAARANLIKDVIEELALIVALAKLAYVSTPVLDSIIELSSVVTGMDLRKEARQLSDLGLIGMDTNEIIELVYA